MYFQIMISKAPLHWSVHIINAVIILTFPSETVAGDGGNFSVRDPQVCGTVRTLAGKTVTLHEGLALGNKDYLAVKKIEGARFKPETGCAFNLCGYSSWAGGEYANCERIRTDMTATTAIYSDKFTTSALTCGCKYGDSECSFGCVAEASNTIWSENGCAVLFQEKKCSHCFFKPIYLSDGETFVKNQSFHFLSMIVRENCYVQQDIPAFKRKLFTYIPTPKKLPIIYGEGSTWDTLNSAYQADLETFNCSCSTTDVMQSDASFEIGNAPVPVIINQNIVTSTGKPIFKQRSESRDGGEAVGLYVSVGIVGIVIVAVVFMGVWFTRRRQSGGTVDSPAEAMQMEPIPSPSSPVIMVVDDTDNDDKDFKAAQAQFNKVCLRENSICRNDFFIPQNDLEKPLQSGNFGIVYKGRRVEGGRLDDGMPENVEVAVKKVGIQDSEVRKRAFFREVKNFQRVGNSERWHQNIVRFHGACCTRDGLFILTEYCEGGSLEYSLGVIRPIVFDSSLPHVEMENKGNGYYVIPSNAEERRLEEIKRTGPRLTQDQHSMFLRWCEQTASGMEYLWQREIIHGDLAPRNILRRNGVIKICDFGLSKEFTAQSAINEMPVNCLAPEVIDLMEGRTSDLPASVDVWAYGCTVWQIYTIGDPLYGHVPEGLGRSQIISRQLVEEWYRHPKPQLASQLIYEKILECWAQDPLNRPSFTHLRKFFDRLAFVAEGGRTETHI